MNEEEMIDILKKMLLIRYFEERVEQLFARGLIFGTTHLYIGEEAVAVGACKAIREDDYITSTHRGHGHFIAKGGDPKRIMAELLGREEGYCKGRGGTQHMAELAIGHLGSNGITGGGIPIATGAALSIKLRRKEQVVVCFFGDGAANQGTFHESLNMASLWRLPVVYVCENNLYGMSTHVKAACSSPTIAGRAQSYNMPGVQVDGNDVLEVKQVVERAVERARMGEGPTLVECQTYRFRGHSKSDKCVYRTQEEENYWKERGPIKRFNEFLIKEGILLESEIKSIEEEARLLIDEAVEYAMKSPFPKPEDVERYLYA
jgi:pyruvate dehydrogenase E1 component alpha subunit